MPVSIESKITNKSVECVSKCCRIESCVPLFIVNITEDSVHKGTWIRVCNFVCEYIMYRLKNNTPTIYINTLPYICSQFQDK